VLHSYIFWKAKVINCLCHLVTLRIACVTLCLTYLSQQRQVTKTPRNKYSTTAVRFQRYNEADGREQHTESELYILVLGDLRSTQRYSWVTAEMWHCVSKLPCYDVSKGSAVFIFKDWVVREEWHLFWIPQLLKFKTIHSFAMSGILSAQCHIPKELNPQSSFVGEENQKGAWFFRWFCLTSVQIIELTMKMYYYVFLYYGENTCIIQLKILT
jgi:hypothetical protein